MKRPRFLIAKHHATRACPVISDWNYSLACKRATQMAQQAPTKLPVALSKIRYYRGVGTLVEFQIFLVKCNFFNTNTVVQWGVLEFAPL
jgi:hypothetical protein